MGQSELEQCDLSGSGGDATLIYLYKPQAVLNGWDKPLEDKLEAGCMYTMFCIFTDTIPYLGNG